MSHLPVTTLTKNKIALIVAVAFLLVLGLVLFLRPVFAGNTILPQTFSVGPVKIHYYGIILATAASVAWLLAMSRAKFYGISAERAEKIMFVCLLVGLLGARLYHVATSWEFYLNNPQLILAFWNGGLGIYGALIGGVVCMAAFAWKENAQDFATKFISFFKLVNL